MSTTTIKCLEDPENVRLNVLQFLNNTGENNLVLFLFFSAMNFLGSN